MALSAVGCFASTARRRHARHSCGESGDKEGTQICSIKRRRRCGVFGKAIFAAFVVALPAQGMACELLGFSPKAFPAELSTGFDAELISAGKIDNDMGLAVELVPLLPGTYTNLTFPATVAFNSETNPRIRFYVNQSLENGNSYSARLIQIQNDGSTSKLCELNVGSVPARLPANLSFAQDRLGYRSGKVGSGVARWTAFGSEEMTLVGSGIFNAFEQDIVVRFVDGEGDPGSDLLAPGSLVVAPDDSGKLGVSVKTVQVPVPLDWLAGCSDWKNPNPAREEGCAQPFHGAVALSLDGGLTFSNAIPLIYEYFRPLKAAFIYPGTVNEFGWTYQLNFGRMQLGDSYLNTVNTQIYFEHTLEGQFAGGQENKGNTFASGTPVPEVINGEPNAYYPAIQLMKSLCDQDYDVVFAGSFGYSLQAIDLARGYAGCSHVGNGSDVTLSIGSGGQDTSQATAGPELHNTTLVVTGGDQYGPTPRYGTAFAKIYQMRYLVGMVAGGELMERDRARKSGRNETVLLEPLCVGYIAAYPIPEVQRGINAFLIGCREVYPECIVKVAWSGTWYDAQVETDIAAFMWNIGKCPVVTQHSDTPEPQKYYASRGGASIGYNADIRRSVGDSVLASAIFNWGPVFHSFIQDVLDHQKRERLGNATRFQEDRQPTDDVWLGVDSSAVKITNFFSPLVSQHVRDRVVAAKRDLEALSGDEALHRIFCGPLKKRWVYRSASEDSNAPKATGCTFQPTWERLAEPEQLDARHFWTAQGDQLSSSDKSATIGSSDCLYGVDFAGQALIADAWPQDPGNDGLRVFNDYLLDGVELFEAQSTLYGRIHSGSDFSCLAEESYAGNTLGDRFFSPPVELPLCNGEQWAVKRGQCNADLMRSDVTYFWADPAQKCSTYKDVAGKYSIPADLPLFTADHEDAPPCDNVAWGSRPASIVTIVSLCGAMFNAVIVIAVVHYRNDVAVVATQPLLVIIMCAGGVVLCLSSLFFLGEPSPANCLLRIWTFNVSFDIVFVFLWSRIYRVRQVFLNAARMRRVRIKDWEMVKLALLIMSIDWLLLVLWTTVDPPLPRETRKLAVAYPEPALGDVMFQECKSNSDVFLVLTVAYKVILVLSACILVLLSRHIPTSFIEHPFVIFAAYNTAIFSAVIMVLTFTMESDPTVALLIHAFGVSIGVSIVNGALALPRIAVAFDKMKLTSDDGSESALSSEQDEQKWKDTSNHSIRKSLMHYGSSFKTTISRNSSSRRESEDFQGFCGEVELEMPSKKPVRVGSTEQQKACSAVADSSDFPVVAHCDEESFSTSFKAEGGSVRTINLA